MTRDPFMHAGSDFDRFLEKLSAEEKDLLVLDEKVDFMSRVAVDHLREKAAGLDITEKGPALLALVAHNDPSCVRLALDFMNDDNPDLKSYGIQAAVVLKDRDLNDKVEELLLDTSASIRIKAISALVSMKCTQLERRLAVVLNDPVWFVREKLASLLNQSGKATNILVKLQSDPNVNVRKAAFFNRVSGL